LSCYQVAPVVLGQENKNRWCLVNSTLSEGKKNWTFLRSILNVSNAGLTNITSITRLNAYLFFRKVKRSKI
jgi:hypothetical protein